MNQSATSDVVEKMRVFRKKQITHSILKDSFDRLLWVVRQEPEDVEEVYLLVGPSGCGKSTLLKRLEADILVLYSKEMETDPGMVPVIFARLTAPQDGNFNWKDFFSRLLEKFNDVLIRRKVILRSEAILDGETITTIRTLVREELRR